MTSGGGGGGISVSKYTVAVEECDNGTVTAAPKTAVKVEARDDGTYAFIMPAGKVTVKAAFAEETAQPEKLPFTDVAKGD